MASVSQSGLNTLKIIPTVFNVTIPCYRQKTNRKEFNNGLPTDRLKGR